MRISLFFLALLYTSFIYSQNTFYGIVKDNNKQPIISASVILKDTNGKIVVYTFSDDSGKYNLHTDKIGNFILSVSSMGFKKKEIEVISDASKKTNES